MKTNIIRVFLLVSILLVSYDTYAQLPAKGGWQSRVGTKTPAKVQDWMQVVFNKPPYSDPTAEVDSLSYVEFYRAFKSLADNAPYVDYTFYSGAFSEPQFDRKSNQTLETSIYDRLLLNFQDPAIRMVILEDILSLTRNFIENLDSVNVVRNNRDASEKAASDTLSLPVAMTKYAHLYYKYVSNPAYYPAHLYDYEQARENYRSAFKMLRDRNIDPGSELEGFYVNEYYRTCEELFKSDEEKYYEQFLQDYLEIVQTCDNLLIPYFDIPDSIKNNPANTEFLKFQSYNYYTNHSEEGVKALFKASGAATPERLNNYYMDRLKDHRKDNDYLSRAINLLLENGCAHTEAFFSYCEASYMIKPTYLNCFGSALSSKKYNMRQEMIQYFSEAYRLAENDLQRGTMAYQIGMALNTPRPVDPSTGQNYATNTPEYAEWMTNMNTASSNLEIVLEMQDAFRNSTSIDIRKYPADAAYALALNIYRLINTTRSVIECDKAISYLKQAKNAAPDKYNVNADGLIANIQNTRTQIAKLDRDKKALAKKQREYEEYLKKKQAEDAFWKQQ